MIRGGRNQRLLPSGQPRVGKVGAGLVQSPQLLKNLRVKNKVPLETLPAVQAKMTEIEHALKGRGRLVVRYSGTEPLLRVMIESDDAAKNDRLMEELLRTIKERIG